MRPIICKRTLASSYHHNRCPGHPRLATLVSGVCAVLAQLSAHSAMADSATGVDTVLGNALNPGWLAAPIPYDPDAAFGKRSPSGRLYGIPYALPQTQRTMADGWNYNGWAEFGGLAGDANTSAALFRMYKDIDNGFYFNNFGLRAEKPGSARFVELEGGGVGRHDGFYGLQFGRYNDWKVKLFYNETPHVFTSTYRSLWSGVGSDNLTLAATTPQLVAGGGNAATATVSENIRTALTTIADSDLELVRKKGGINFGFNLTERWKAYASYAHEKREGARPFGAVWGGGGGGGNVELPESIDYTTHELAAGVRYADARQSFNAQVSASLFRNNIGTMTFQNPLTVTITGPAGLTSGLFTAGRYDLVPDNDFYQVRGEYARSFPEFYKSRFTAVVSTSSSRQDDQLIEPSLFALTGGTNTATATSLADRWNTTAALSRQSADAKIDTTLVDLNLSASPHNALSVSGKVRYYETKNDTNYWACNPLTGEWGRIINEGSGTVLAGANLVAGNNPPGTSAAAFNTAACNLAAARALNIVPNIGNAPIGAVPIDYRQMNYRLNGDYRLGKASSVIGTYERETFDREHRERDRTSEDKYKLEYANRGFESATLRASFEHARRRGSEYIANPYKDYFSAALGPTPTANNTNVATWIRTVSSLRKYDLADRNSNVLNTTLNMALRPDLDAGITAQWKDLDYPASDFGRNDHERRGSIGIDVNYQPSTALGVYGFYSHQTGKMKQAGVQNSACVIGSADVTAANFETLCGMAGGPLYPFDRAWNVSSDDRNDVAGFGLRYDFGRALFDVNYTYSHGRTKIRYEYGAGIPLTPTQIALLSNGFSDLTFTQNVLETSVLVPINKTVGVRFYYRYDTARISDWHYDGVAQNPVPANGTVYLDNGPQNYRANVFGVFLRLTL